MVAQSFQATANRERSSSTVDRWCQPQPVIFRWVKSLGPELVRRVRRENSPPDRFLPRLTLSRNSSAAFTTMVAGLAIRSWAFSSLYTFVGETVPRTVS